MTTSLAFQSYNDDQEKTILFLHGGGVGGWMWQPVVERLPDFQSLVPDMPEHGRSKQARPFTIPFAAEQTGELIRDQAHDGKAVVVGLSEGAQVVVEMLATLPDLIESALVSSALLLPIPSLKWLSKPSLLAWAYRLSFPPFRNSDWWMRLNMKYSAAIPEKFFTQYQENFRLMDESQFVNLMVANQAYRLPEHLEIASVPVLVVAGKSEDKMMIESVRLLSATLPNAQAGLVDLGEGSSKAKEHNWAMNAPDLFAQTVRNFINGSSLPETIQPLSRT